MPTDRRAAWLILLAAVLWGTTGTAQDLGPDGAGSLAVGSARLVVGGAGFVVLSLLRGRRPWMWDWPPGLLGLTAVAIAAYQVTFFGAVRLTGVAAGTIVALGSGPVFGGLLDRVVQRRSLPLRWFASTGLAVLGAVLLVGAGDTRLEAGGVALALAAGGSYAVYALGIKLLAADRHPDDVVVVAFGAGALLVAPILLASDPGRLLSPAGVAMELHLGLVTVTLAYLLFARGVAAVDVGVATTLSLSEPVTAAILGVLVLGERLGPWQWVGVAVVLTGLALLALPGVGSGRGPRPVSSRADGRWRRPPPVRPSSPGAR